MFQMKNMVSVAAALLNHFRGVQSEVTDLNVGGVARTMLEASAIEIDELYQQMFNGIKEAIPVAVFNAFSFSKRSAIPASGLMLVTITASATDTLISAGTVFANSALGTNYVSQEDVIIADGDTTGEVLVAATLAGVIGNIPSAQSFTASPAPSNFVSAVNVGAYITGEDEETDDERKQRFAVFVSTLPRGTKAALVYGAKQARIVNSLGLETERVRTVSVVEPYLADINQPIAWVKVFIHNGVGSTSADLVARAAEVIAGYTDENDVQVPGWKAAGVHVDVIAATEVPVDVTGTLTAAPGYDSADLCQMAEDTITAYLRSLGIGETYLESEAVFRVKSIEGVVNITGLPADLTSDEDEKIMPDAISVVSA